jgi:hypothetical protein
MKIIIEMRNGEIDGITTTENCTIFIINHDNKRAFKNNRESMKIEYSPNFVTYEDDSDTSLFDEQLDDIITSGIPTTGYRDSVYS